MEFHKLSEIFPLMKTADLKELAEDIKESGLREPIITYEGKILDGRNRYLACTQVGVELIFEPYENLPSYTHTQDPLNYVISLNLNRRHLTFEQRVKVAADIATMRSGERTDLAQKCARLSQKQAAEKMNVGERSVEQYNHIKKHGIPELLEAVESGVIPIYAGYELSFSPIEKQLEIREQLSEEQLESIENNRKEITDKAKTIRNARTQERKEKRIKELNNQRNVIELGLPIHEREYDVIVIDPPWPYGTQYDPEGRRAANPYPEMSMEEISGIKLPASKDCVLWLWVPIAFLKHAYSLLENWGFKDKTMLTWDKQAIGLGAWLRTQTEHCIMAVQGKPVISLTNQSTLLQAKRREHSRKPDEFYKLVDSLCHGRKLDYFSREQRLGWDSYGSEIDRFSKNNSKKNAIKKSSQETIPLNNSTHLVYGSKLLSNRG